MLPFFSILLCDLGGKIAWEHSLSFHVVSLSAVVFEEMRYFMELLCKHWESQFVLLSKKTKPKPKPSTLSKERGFHPRANLLHPPEEHLLLCLVFQVPTWNSRIVWTGPSRHGDAFRSGPLPFDTLCIRYAICGLKGLEFLWSQTCILTHTVDKGALRGQQQGLGKQHALSYWHTGMCIKGTHLQKSNLALAHPPHLT